MSAPKRQSRGAERPPRFPGILRSEQLRNHLLGWIAGLPPGERLPSERALARESGLSLLTVNKIMATIAAQGLVERRRGRGTFVGDRSDPESDGRLKMIRLVVGQPEEALRTASHGYLANFYRGLCEGAAADGVEILPTPFALGAEGLQSLPQDAFASPSIQGLVFVECGTPDYRPLWRFLEEGRRVVALDMSAPERGLNSVLFDNAGGICLAVDHCRRHGHRRFAYLGPVGSISQPAEERLRGFRQALSASGVHEAPLVLSRDDPPARLRQVLSAPGTARPTAVVAFMDLDLLPVLEAAGELGLEVPRDLSLVGFGDGLAREFGRAPREVDSIQFDEMDMGRTAYALWKSGAKGVIKRQQGSLVDRGSVAAAP